MSLMYFLFAKHGILPRQYYDLPAGEKVIVRAFAEHYVEEANN